ncbi:MAG: DUF3108 domain-containing protein [Bacteroidia bacterium]|nr:DUF3108 domain-containing protein [Bacteroidia bacterium]
MKRATFAAGWVAAVLLTAYDTPKYRTIYARPFAPGEKVVYRVHYGWFTAGYATFSVAPKLEYHNGRACYRLYGEGRSLSSFDWFYKVDDRFTSWMDAEAVMPWKYEKHWREGDYRYDDTVAFDHDARTIRGRNGKFSAPEYTQDMLTAFYYARCLDLNRAETGRVFPIPTFFDDGVYPLGLKVLGKETISCELGKVRCVKVAPILIAGRVFKGEQEMTIWITDDENRLPVRIESPVIVGSIRADIHSYENLAHPLAAKTH